MKLTVLTDNNTIINQYFLGEPALSFYIEIEDKKILFDTGYSDVFLKNAQKLKINLKNLDYIILSHGHDDHTGGLKHIKELLKDEAKKPQIIACNNVFDGRYDENGDFGCPLKKSEIEKTFDVIYAKEPYFISDDIVFLGPIKRTTDFEAKEPDGINRETNSPDFVKDDSALAVKTDEGLVIITGCSHSGIVNICKQARSVFKTEKIKTIIGGLHLINASSQQLTKTVDYIASLNTKELYTCHCTGLKAQFALNSISDVKETGSGSVLYF